MRKREVKICFSLLPNWTDALNAFNCFDKHLPTAHGEVGLSFGKLLI
jgi:hypothetical protein